MNPPKPPMRLSEKIIARAANRAWVRPGEIVTCQVDLAMMHDSGGPRRVDPKLRELGVGIWDKSKVVVVSDHYAPAVDADSAQILQFTRGWVAEQGIDNFYDMRGICHVVLAEGMHVRPNMFCVGGDSHSPTGGAWGAFMVGVGATEMAGVLATGELWVKVPETLLVDLQGSFQFVTCAKDLLLHLLKTLGQHNDYQVMEFSGGALAQIGMQERMTLCNMTAELGCKTGIIAADEITAKAFADRSGSQVARSALDKHVQLAAAMRSDLSAPCARTVHVQLDQLSPQVAAPHSPENVSDASVFNAIKLDQCYLGACTGAKLDDLQMAASVLKGKKVAAHTRLLVAPASLATMAAASRDGTLTTLLEAGAILLPTGCGACAGLGAGLLASKEVCLASTARNFKGRMGAKDSEVYLASPFTVAASAVRGFVTDPRELAA
jgi:3-isopropylmalate/(R)-2-methylmalate dehydratase large subunit